MDVSAQCEVLIVMSPRSRRFSSEVREYWAAATQEPSSLPITGTPPRTLVVSSSTAATGWRFNHYGKRCSQEKFPTV